MDPSGEIQAYPYPCKINFSDFYCLLNPSWYQMGRGREVSFNSLKCFSALVKIFPCGRFKNFKTNIAVLTIVMGLENILCWNQSLLWIRKTAVFLCIPPFLIFLFITSVCDVFARLCLVSVDYMEYL